MRPGRGATNKRSAWFVFDDYTETRETVEEV
jgi:hypothetical protein